jgi:hypothetical protein
MNYTLVIVYAKDFLGVRCPYREVYPMSGSWLRVHHEILRSVEDCLSSGLQKRWTVTVAKYEVIFPGNNLRGIKVSVLSMLDINWLLDKNVLPEQVQCILGKASPL